MVAAQLVADLRRDEVAIDFQPIDPEPPGFLRVAKRIKYVRTLVVSIFYLAALLRRVPRYDVVHIFSASYLSFMIAQAPAILIARFFRKKVVLSYHSGECDDHLRRWGRVVYPLLRMVDRIVVPSGYLVEVFAKHGFSATPIPNIIDVEKFRFRKRAELRPKLLVPRMLEPLYNISCAIRAFSIIKERIPDASMTILGTGTQEEELKQLVESLALADVEFAGRVERDEIAAVYDDHDLFLNSSSIDNLPVSILEAFAAGLPVVTTAAGGIPYVVEDRETGHVVAVDDHRALAERVLEVLSRPAETGELIEAAYEEVQKYRWPSVGEKWHRLNRSLADTPSRG